MQRLISVTADLKQIVDNTAVDQWCPRLRTSVRDKGQHFEQLLVESLLFLDKFVGLLISLVSGGVRHGLGAKPPKCRSVPTVKHSLLVKNHGVNFAKFLKFDGF